MQTTGSDWPGAGSGSPRKYAEAENARRPAGTEDAPSSDAARRPVRNDVRAQRTSGASSAFEHGSCSSRHCSAARHHGQSRHLEDQRALPCRNLDTRT
eukprot:4635444-Pleurochrysis_carterae.AAC.3